MKISSTTYPLADKFGLKEAVDIMADAGFDAIDFSAMTEEFFSDAHSKEYYTEIRKYAEDKGLIFNQSHAPFPSAVINEEENETKFKNVVNGMRNASYLGVRDIVVHPCQHLKYLEGNNKEILFDYNMKFYKCLIPYCEEYGIRVALENMWQPMNREWRKISHSTCAKPSEFIQYLDTLDNDCFIACLDIGHAVLVCEDVADFIRALGGKRLQALHVHDVDGMVDSHTLPYFGVTDWEGVMKALADINYTGDLTFESNGEYLKGKPDQLYPELMRFMAVTGKHLRGIFENHKN